MSTKKSNEPDPLILIMKNEVGFFSLIVIKIFFALIFFDIFNMLFFYFFDSIKKLVLSNYILSYMSESKDAIDIMGKSIKSIASNKASDFLVHVDIYARIIKFFLRYIFMYVFSFIVAKYLRDKINGIN